jgi:transcriptional regulator with XRE-family HTH domain
MDFPPEDDFNLAFQARLAETRRALDWSHPRMAHRLGIKTDAYKKYEKRPGSAFPLYLLSRLVYETNRPLSYWLEGQPVASKRLRIVTSS